MLRVLSCPILQQEERHTDPTVALVNQNVHHPALSGCQGLYLRGQAEQRLQLQFLQLRLLAGMWTLSRTWLMLRSLNLQNSI